MPLQDYGRYMAGTAEVAAAPANALLGAYDNAQQNARRNALTDIAQQRTDIQWQQAQQDRASQLQGQQAEQQKAAEIEQARAILAAGRSGNPAARAYALKFVISKAPPEVQAGMAQADPEQLWSSIEPALAQAVGEKPQPGQLYQTAEGFLPAEQAVGKMPYQAPQRAPMEAPAKPQLVDVPQPDGTTQKQWVYPGQSRGAPVGAPTTTAAAAKPPTEADKKVATLFGSMVTAANNLADLAGADTSSLGNAALDSNPLTRAATSGDYRKYQSAAKQWSANLLYIKSGATATPEEVYSTYQQFFPQPGDTEEVKAQKAAAREQEMRNIQATYPDTTKQYKWKSQSTSPASGAPQIGEVKKGYRYKGGDPASPSSWEKVK